MCVGSVCVKEKQMEPSVALLLATLIVHGEVSVSITLCIWAADAEAVLGSTHVLC